MRQARYAMLVSLSVLVGAIVGAAGGRSAGADAGTPAAMPAAGKTDTLEQDRYLRRLKHPLQVKVVETAGEGGENVPLTLSVACGEGDYPAGALCPMLAGEPVPAQVDVLATWPGDGSVKHALVSLVLPRIAANEAVTFTFRPAAPAAPGKFVAAVDVKALAFQTEFDNPDGKKTVSAIDAATRSRIADVLNGRIAGEEARKLAPRLAGPVCYEFEVKAPAETGGAADADIDVYYRLRMYSGLNGVRVEYDVENSRLPAKPYPAQFTVTDRDFSKLTFQAGPSDKPETLYEQAGAAHWFGTRYRVCKWWGRQPISTFAKEDAAYLIYSEFLPKIDLDHPMTEQQLRGRVESVTRAGWYRDPAEFPDGPPLSNGPLMAHMGGTGGRPEIGVYPLWAVLALASDSPMMLHYARLSEGNALAAFPVHFRPGENGHPGIAWDDPIHQMLYDIGAGRPVPVTHARSRTPCGNHPDTGHVPSVSYYTYLATGEKFYEEEMSFWGARMLWRWNSKGYLTGHTRYEAWPIRNATDAAFILPDAHPLKKYFADFVQRTIDYQSQLVKDPAKYWTGPRCVSGRKNWVCSGQFSMWMQCFYIWALDNAARKGFPSAAGARDDAADLLLRLYEGKEEFKAPDGETYRWANPGIAVPYSIAIDVRRLDCSDPKRLKDTYVRNITDNTGAMYYYTMVNVQNEFYGPKETAALVERLPKKVMEPEDWRVDPEFAQKYGKAFSGYTVDINGNGPTSAALARYDNPRAQKMYQIVRDLLEKHVPEGKRLRATEFVK